MVELDAGTIERLDAGLEARLDAAAVARPEGANDAGDVNGGMVAACWVEGGDHTADLDMIERAAGWLVTLRRSRRRLRRSVNDGARRRRDGRTCRRRGALQQPSQPASDPVAESRNDRRRYRGTMSFARHVDRREPPAALVVRARAMSKTRLGRAVFHRCAVTAQRPLEAGSKLGGNGGQRFGGLDRSAPDHHGTVLRMTERQPRSWLRQSTEGIDARGRRLSRIRDSSRRSVCAGEQKQRREGHEERCVPTQSDPSRQGITGVRT